MKSQKPAKSRTGRLATALWNLERRKLQDLEREPAFHQYADGKQEPMPFHKQDADFRAYWRRVARRLLRAMR